MLSRQSRRYTRPTHTLVFDTIVVSLTFAKTFRLALQTKHLGIQDSLSAVILRDGILFSVSYVMFTKLLPEGLMYYLSGRCNLCETWAKLCVLDV